jgi:transposase
MQPILESCCGLDVHKSMIKACIAKGPLDKPPKFEIRTFSTMTSDLLKLKDWLIRNEVESVAMESTGVYWKPIFNILEDSFDIVLANPQYLKKVPGKKSDVKDSQWIATLLRSGLIPNSFIPPREIRELRDLNRTRRKHIEITTSEKNRLQKVLEDANIKLGSVVSKIDGKSSMKMIHALLEKDVLSREDISEMARGKLKSKVPKLVEALKGRVTEHHRFLLRFHLDNIAFQLEQIQELDEEIQRRMVPFQNEYRLIQTLPGISKTSAAAIIAEIGTDMSQFPDEAHLSSWAGMCPGNNESAGIKKSGKTRKGNGFLKGILTEVAWAASRTKDSAYSAIYNGIAKRRGKKRALIALGHRILCDIYRVLTDGEDYVDEGAEAVFQRNSKAREGAMIRALVRSGYAITKVTA